MKKIIEITPESKLKIQNSSKLTESWIPELPSVYQIEVMSKCNFRCNFCKTGMSGEPYLGDSAISNDLFYTILDRDLSGSSFIELQFRGEPTLNKNLFNYVKALRTKKLFVGFSTHGNLLHQHHALRAALHSHYVTISMDAAEKDLYESYRLGGAWERLIMNINLLVHEKGARPFPIIDLQLIEFEGVEDQVKKLRRLVQEFGWDVLAGKSLRIRTIKDTQASVQHHSTELCTNPWYSVSIKANGDVVPCCMAFEDDVELVYGNLHNDSLKTIWNSDKVKQFRLMHRQDKLPETCQKCYARSPHNFHQNLMNDILKEQVL